ncbi:MAG: DUF4249 domain-containing protein [Muribaculaceae bacterium]|nr:DUF4249 domain-containing protein [Muribaculaceae bacterium]
MKSQIAIILLLLLNILASCSKEYPAEEQKLVIEGWIENGEFPVVLVSLSGNIDNDGDEVADFMVRWAKVSIHFDDKTYILTGSPDKRYFPPYSYISYDFRGEAGKTYTLEVEYKGMKATAKTTVPTPIEIDSISVGNVEDNDTLRSINVHFTPDRDETDYFRIRYREYNTESRFYPSFLGTISTRPSDGKISIPLYRAKLKTTKDYIPYFPIGSVVEVRLSRINKESYDIWCDYDNIVNFGSNIFFKQQTNLYTNIQGGYGYWIGYGISKSRIKTTK